MTPSAFYATGTIAQLPAETRRALMDRSTSSDTNIRAQTAEIIAETRARGDAALSDFAARFDGVALETFEVPRAQWARALDTLDASLRTAMERSAANIAAVHRAFLPEARETSPEPGIRIVRRADPLDRVGVYAPGGRAAYPSSVLMGAVPARVAGVREVIVCSPPDRSGTPSQVVLAAAQLAQADRVFALGGAGAIAAMAYGTDSVPKVDRIVGPGNAYVAEAKLQVSGAVAIDSPAGPSELLVVTDDTVNAEIIAREVFAQAEHDPRAAVVVIAVGEGVAEAVARVISEKTALQTRSAIIREALQTRGAVLQAESLAQAVAFSNDYAPEHLLLACDAAIQNVSQFRNAGTIFAGTYTSVAYGDYMTGANHVLPTGGLARSYSGLSVLDFMRWTTEQYVDQSAAARLAPDVGIFADAEGLPAHAAAARAWGTQPVEAL